MEPDRLLDAAGLEILRALQDNARVSFAELGRKIGLSAPAVTDRVRKMEEAGIILGFHASINPAMHGLAVTAYAGLITPRENLQAIIALSRDLAQVRECHHCTSGQHALLLKVVAASLADLESVLDRFRPFGELRTFVVQSTPVQKYPA